jgi:hypothetical protein
VLGVVCGCGGGGLGRERLSIRDWVVGVRAAGGRRMVGEGVCLDGEEERVWAIAATSFVLSFRPGFLPTGYAFSPIQQPSC